MSVDAFHPNKVIESKLEAIYSLHTKKTDFRLDSGPYRDILIKLGNPQNHLPPAIHLAGTNGKGSTLAFLKGMLEAAGKTVHCYTSPHLLTFNERITLSGKHIDDDALIHYLDLIEITNDGAPLTFFEFTTAMAFKAMADHPADICLIETGLGGRLDCTNVIERPLATIITSIGHDHMEWLGDSLEKIAFEKAGIMKAGVPCIIAPQQYDGETRPVFEKQAQILNAPLHFTDRIKSLPPLGLIGDHQQDNASTAITTLKIIHPDITQDIISAGLAQTQWPARMEKLSTSPDIWFDCGHNAEGAEVIATQLKQWKTDQPDRPIHLILGLAGDKDPNGFLKPIWSYCDSITCVNLPNARNPQTGTDLAAKITNAPIPVRNESCVRDALPTLSGLIMITGSLYLYEQAKEK